MCCTCRFMSDQEAWTELADLYLERNKSVPITVLLLQLCQRAMCVCAQLREGGVLSGGAAAGQPSPPPLPPALRRGLVHSTAPLTDYRAMCIAVYWAACIAVYWAACIAVYWAACIAVYWAACIAVYWAACIAVYWAACIAVYWAACIAVYWAMCCIVHTCRSATPRRQWKAWRLPGSTLPSQLNSTLTTCGHSTVSTWSAPGTQHSYCNVTSHDSCSMTVSHALFLCRRPTLWAQR